jgi:hypothetical protein
MATDPLGGSADTHRFGVRCARCGRTQPPDRRPPIAHWPYCVFCAAPLPVQRWVAMPPLGLGPAPRVRRVSLPYAGPPRYGALHPAWGFPPVARLREHDPLPGEDSARPVSDASLGRRLTAAVSLALATFLACLAAGPAGGWRVPLRRRRPRLGLGAPR